MTISLAYIILTHDNTNNYLRAVFYIKQHLFIFILLLGYLKFCQNLLEYIALIGCLVLEFEYIVFNSLQFFGYDIDKLVYCNDIICYILYTIWFTFLTLVIVKQALKSSFKK